MLLGPNITARFDSGNTVGSTAQVFALTPATANTYPNLLVYGFDLYTSHDSAQFHAQVQRIETYTENSTSGSTNSARASLTTRDRRGALVSSTGGIQRISDHTFNANAPLEFRFPEPLEVKKDWQSSSDHYFAIEITRKDADTAVAVYANIYYIEY